LKTIKRKRTLEEIVEAATANGGTVHLARAVIRTGKSVSSVAFTVWVAAGRKRLGKVTSAGDGSPMQFEPAELEAIVASVSDGDVIAVVMRWLSESEDERDYARRLQRRRVLFVRHGRLRQSVRYATFDDYVEKKAAFEVEYPGDVLNNLEFEVAAARFRQLSPLPVSAAVLAAMREAERKRGHPGLETPDARNAPARRASARSV
jgi:hypothetical protein